MAKLDILAGATSVSVAVFIQDSSSTTGAGLTGLVYNTSGLTCYAVVPGASAASVSLATLAAANSAWATGGFKEIDATNMPGWYRFDIPNANIASGRSVGFHFKGATNMAPLPLEISLTGWNNQDAVRGGLTALPNANAEAAGGLFTRGTGAGQIEQEDNGKVSINVKQWLRGTIPAVSVTGVPIIDLKYILGTALTETAGLLAGGFKKFFNVASPTLTCLGVDQTGDSYARLGAPAGASVSADIAAVAGFIDTEVAAILAAVDTEVAAILALLDDPRTEPGQGNPPVNPDMATKVDYLYKSWRNKKDNDGSTSQLYADNGTTVDQKSTTSLSLGVVTAAEWVSGP